MTMKVQVMPVMSDFQLLVVLLTRHFKERGATPDEITSVTLSQTVARMPQARRLLEKMGLQWHWPLEEQERLAKVVRYNVSFWQKRIYVYTDVVVVEADRMCQHKNPFYCLLCQNDPEETDGTLDLMEPDDLNDDTQPWHLGDPP